MISVVEFFRTIAASFTHDHRLETGTTYRGLDEENNVRTSVHRRPDAQRAGSQKITAFETGAKRMFVSTHIQHKWLICGFVPS
ncbi:MAG: hypothetical protein ACKVT0_09370 [Planctomycetaceae bacterium]